MLFLLVVWFHGITEIILLVTDFTLTTLTKFSGYWYYWYY